MRNGPATQPLSTASYGRWAVRGILLWSRVLSAAIECLLNDNGTLEGFVSLTVSPAIARQTAMALPTLIYADGSR
jgi:hypothetical protein